MIDIKGSEQAQPQHPQHLRTIQGHSLLIGSVEGVVKKKYQNLNDRVQRTVSAYGQSEVLLYLRAIAHSSHV